MKRRYLYSPLFILAIAYALFPPSIMAKTPDSAVVFMYHRFAEDTIPSTNIRIEQFEEQLHWLQENNYNVWPLKKIISHLREKQPIPDKTIAITMDDAYLSVFTHAYPRLKSLQWPFTVFVSTNYIDRGYSNYMNWEQMRSLRNDGVDFANHTASHYHLIEKQAGESNEAWMQRVTQDIEQAQQRLNKELGDAEMFLAYPYGEYNQTIQQLVEGMGYIGFGQHSGAIGRDSDFTALPRFPISEAYGAISGFAEKAKTLPLPLQAISNHSTEITNHQIPASQYRIKQAGVTTSSINCFATGEGRIEIEQLDRLNLSIPSREQKRFRRSRYNCTAPSGMAGRYYWFSQLWINTLIKESEE